MDEKLLPPRQAIVAFFARVPVAPAAVERVPLGQALGRVLAEPIAADDDYPSAPRSVMDGFAVRASETPGEFRIAGDVRMGGAPESTLPRRRGEPAFPTGGMLPDGADAVVPIEDVRVAGDSVSIGEPVAAGDERRRTRGRHAARRGGPSPAPAHSCGRRRRARDARSDGGSASTGVPSIAVFSSGDELVDPGVTPARGRDPRFQSLRRCRVAAAMGAVPRHYPTLRDEARRVSKRRCDRARRVRRGRRHRRVVGRRTRSSAGRRRGDRRSRHRRTRAADQAGKADALRRGRREADRRPAG